MTMEKLNTFTRWRTEVVLTLASIVGLGGFIHELFLTGNPNWIKLAASVAAIAGAPAAILNVIPSKPTGMK